MWHEEFADFSVSDFEHNVIDTDKEVTKVTIICLKLTIETLKRVWNIFKITGKTAEQCQKLHCEKSHLSKEFVSQFVKYQMHWGWCQGEGRVLLFSPNKCGCS